MNKIDIDKRERLLYFLKTFPNRGLEMVRQNRDGTLAYKVNDNIIVEKPHYERNSYVIFYKHTERTVNIDHVLKVYIEEDDVPQHSFYNDDYYKEFLYFNPTCPYIEFTVCYDNHTNLDIPTIDLETEEGQFQTSLLYEDGILGIMTYVQHMQRKGFNFFADWFHPKIDEIYEVLNDTFNIGREDYLSGDGIL